MQISMNVRVSNETIRHEHGNVNPLEGRTMNVIFYIVATSGKSCRKMPRQPPAREAS
jgi:hypothetical protein